MQKTKKFPWAAVTLLLVLIVAIGGVGTVLVGRAMGWWSYADLPVLGRFFPDSDPPTAEPPEDDPQETIAALQAELQSREMRISELSSLLDGKEQEMAVLQSQIDDLEQGLLEAQQQKEDKELQATAKMFENMRPEQAASILANYTNQEVFSLLMLMPSETAGAILAKFDPARAAAIAALPR